MFSRNETLLDPVSKALFETSRHKCMCQDEFSCSSSQHWPDCENIISTFELCLKPGENELSEEVRRLKPWKSSHHKW